MKAAADCGGFCSAQSRNRAKRASPEKAFRAGCALLLQNILKNLQSKKL